METSGLISEGGRVLKLFRRKLRNYKITKRKCVSCARVGWTWTRDDDNNTLFAEFNKLQALHFWERLKRVETTFGVAMILFSESSKLTKVQSKHSNSLKIQNIQHLFIYFHF